MRYLETQIHNTVEGEAVIIAEINGDIQYCNEAALHEFQYQSVKEIRRLNLINLMPDDFAPFFPKEITQEHLSAINYVLNVTKRKSGELFACKLRTNHQQINGKTYVVAHIKPIYEDLDFEKVRLQQNIEALKRELEAERNKNINQAFQETTRQLSICFPNLSANDLKVCYYLTQNYNSKLISQELNITIDGVFAARKRIRKKLGLSPDEDLVKVLLHCCMSL